MGSGSRVGTRFVWKVFGVTVLVLIVAVVAADLHVARVVSRDRRAFLERRFVDEAVLVARSLEQRLAWEDGVPWSDPAQDAATREFVRRLAEDLHGHRVTVIARDGRVVADSHEDATVMENHADRPELSAPGTVHERFSETLRESMSYAAAPIATAAGTVGYARVASASTTIQGRIDDILTAVHTGAGIAALIALIAAAILAHRVTRPLQDVREALSAVARGDRAKRLPVKGSDEIAALSGAVNELADEVQVRVDRLRRDREQDRAIYAAMDEGVVMVDADGRVRVANEAARRLLETFPEDPRGNLLWEVTRQQPIVDAVSACLTERRRVLREETIHPRGHEVVVHLSAVPLHADDESVRGCVMVLYDLTEIRRLEAVRRDFVANVSHELKTPLTSMQGYLEAVREDPEMPAGQRDKFLAKAEAATHRQTAIVTDLLTLARLEAVEAGRFASLDLADVLHDAVRELRSSAEMKDVAIEEVVVGGPFPMLGDEAALTTAIGNLVDNAIKYSPAQGRVRVALVRDGDEAHFDVFDEGPGIPAHDQKRVFERFYRVNKDRSRELGGTGLGLSIVKHAVGAHAGDVWVESTVGKGSTFRVRLPLQLEDPEAPREDPERPESADRDSPAAGDPVA